MTKKQKQQWVKALTSGKFLQGMGYLRHHLDDGETSYCCLGVLDELTEGKYRDDDITETSNSSSPLKEDFLSRQWQKKLSGFNDTGKSFKWIASYINRYIK